MDRKRAFKNLVLFLGVLGPGIVTGSVDNDAGGITTYSVAGATYGYNLLWTLFPAFIVLFVVQEMNARMGVVTGKGLADLIRENFGVRMTFFIFLALLVADIGNTATEFAGIAGSMEVFGVSKYISVPAAAAGIWIFAVKGNYNIAERVFLLFSLFLFSYVISALMAGPEWGVIGRALVTPEIKTDLNYLGMTIGIIGTTIAPWMLFYLQSAVIEKRLRVEDLRYTVWDVMAGCLATVVVAFFIIVACASTLHKNGVVIEHAADAALALKPLAGHFASKLFAFGLLTASVFSAVILPLAASFYICEAFGFEAGIDRKMGEAPQFYALFASIIALSAGIILIPGAPLIKITIWTQVLNGALLPVALVSIMMIVNKREIMGNYTNTPFQNAIGWTTITLLIGLTAYLVITPLVT